MGIVNIMSHNNYQLYHKNSRTVILHFFKRKLGSATRIHSALSPQSMERSLHIRVPEPGLNRSAHRYSNTRII